MSLQDLDFNQTSTDNYLDKYIPFRIQNFISESMEVVLDSQQMMNFMDFERRKYQHMHAKIYRLDDEPHPPEQIIPKALIKQPNDLMLFENDFIEGVNGICCVQL